ncbi:MAG: hypothetical protein LKI24_09800 [Acidipropionibacterium sp.]|jgi:hypothetical protein|nr:hypothetical protein [Acidipropionibacterium sp.]
MHVFLPAVLRDWRGLFLPYMEGCIPDHGGRQRFALVIDYQNVHLTAADVFLPDQPREDALIHPVWFAEQLARAKSAANARKGYPEAIAARVEVY